jgi:hypothetical protein
MRAILVSLFIAPCLAVSATHAADVPTREPIQSAVGRVPAPTPAEAQAAMRSWAEQLAARDPQAAKDRQVQEARTTMKVKSVKNCEAEPRTGHLICSVGLDVAGKRNVSTNLKFAWEGGGWKFVSRQ